MSGACFALKVEFKASPTGFSTDHLIAFLMLLMCLPRSYISCRLREKWACSLLCTSLHSAILRWVENEEEVDMRDLVVKAWLVAFQASSIAFAALARWCST